MKLIFEPDYRSKILAMSFAEPTALRETADVLRWRAQWLSALSSWHSPYKAMIDCRQLEIPNPTPDLSKALTTMLTFFNGFFLKKAVGYGYDASRGHDALPFPVVASYEQAAEELGVRGLKPRAAGGDFRSSLQFDNHFRQHVVEMTCSAPVVFDSSEKVALLKDKLTNNLMQWHSAWSLLIDCSQVSFDASVHGDFQKMEKFFKGFFLKKIIGYSPSQAKETYPFAVFRARHRAAAELEGEGNFSGEQAQCASRKAP